MLEFVEKLTLYPWLLVRTDVTRLRSAGFPDTTILHIVLGSAHFNYLNRMADGIGIRFEYQTEVPGSSSPSSEPQSAKVVVIDSDLPQSSHKRLAWIEFPESNEPPTGSEGPQNLYRLMSPNPEARELAREWRNYQMKGTTRLDTRLRSQLGLYISGINHCEYSAYWISKSLESLGELRSVCERLGSGKAPRDLPTREELLFTHARRLTHEPANTKEDHIHELRQAGLDDQGILQLTMLCSYLSFENRVALALGVPIESETS